MSDTTEQHLELRAMRLLPLYAYNHFSCTMLYQVYPESLATHFESKLVGYMKNDRTQHVTLGMFFKLYGTMTTDNQDLMNKHILEHYEDQY